MGMLMAIVLATAMIAMRLMVVAVIVILIVAISQTRFKTFPINSEIQKFAALLANWA